MKNKQEILIILVAYLSSRYHRLSPFPFPLLPSPYRPSKTPGTRRRPLHRRLIRTRSTDARCERDLRVGPHHDRRRERVRLGAHHIAGGYAVADNDVVLDAGDVGDVVGVGEAADIAAWWARFPDRVARCCGRGVGYGVVDAEGFGARGGGGYVSRESKKGGCRIVYVGEGSATYKSMSTPDSTVMLNDFV